MIDDYIRVSGMLRYNELCFLKRNINAPKAIQTAVWCMIVLNWGALLYRFTYRMNTTLYAFPIIFSFNAADLQNILEQF